MMLHERQQARQALRSENVVGVEASDDVGPRVAERNIAGKRRTRFGVWRTAQRD